MQFQDILGQWSAVSRDTILHQNTEIVFFDTLQSNIAKAKALSGIDSVHFFMVDALEGDSLVFKTSKALIIDIYDSYGLKLKTIASNQSMQGMGVRAKLDGQYYAVVRGFVGQTGTYNITYTPALVHPYYKAKAQDGSTVFTIDNNGNMEYSAPSVTFGAISGTYTNSFIIRNASNTIKFVFNQTEAKISGSLIQNCSQSTLDAYTTNNLVIKSNTGAVVARFDEATGNLYLKGIVIE